MHHVVLLALLATLGTWALTALGAAVVLFFKKPQQDLMRLLLGFGSGVMIAASFWSLLAPAAERAAENGNLPAWFVVTFGFLFGAVFLYLCDKIVSRMEKKRTKDSARTHRILLLVSSITLHNIPEGLAVGVAFGAAASGDTAALLGALSVAVGIGLQNFPEGAAVSLPLRREGVSRAKSFFWGQASGMVEPIAGVLGALLVSHMERILPFALSFAAGAMLFVVTHALIPECETAREARPYLATMGVMVGFAVMTLLDVALG